MEEDKKKIVIVGKNNIDKLSNKPKIRVSSNSWKNKIDAENVNQTEMVNKLYMDIPFDLDEDIKKEIYSKIDGYKNQDIKKNIFSEDEIITYEELLNKLTASGLRCYYCKKKVKLLYTNVRDPQQWTLDRLNNDLGHTHKNTVICDLKCNLQRRCQNDELFLLSKRLTIVKTE
tara:strand:- start:685 stop:1203 length:519 start_codon:yes stop_codon:yes gene_type:complete